MNKDGQRLEKKKGKKIFGKETCIEKQGCDLPGAMDDSF